MNIFITAYIYKKHFVAYDLLPTNANMLVDKENFALL